MIIIPTIEAIDAGAFDTTEGGSKDYEAGFNQPRRTLPDGTRPTRVRVLRYRSGPSLQGPVLPLVHAIAYREHMAVGWETSRHPEWEIMYAAGLTVREIAERVGRARSTVQRHLQVREIYIPGLRASHEAARAKRPPGWQRHPQQEQHAADDDTR